jgi:hypothetical protein
MACVFACPARVRLRVRGAACALARLRLRDVRHGLPVLTCALHPPPVSTIFCAPEPCAPYIAQNYPPCEHRRCRDARCGAACHPHRLPWHPRAILSSYASLAAPIAVLIERMAVGPRSKLGRPKSRAWTPEPPQTYICMLGIHLAKVSERHSSCSFAYTQDLNLERATFGMGPWERSSVGVALPVVLRVFIKLKFRAAGRTVGSGQGSPAAARAAAARGQAVRIANASPSARTYDHMTCC